MGVSCNVEISSTSKVKVNRAYVLTVASSAKNNSRCQLYASALENLIFVHLPSATIRANFWCMYADISLSATIVDFVHSRQHCKG